MDTAEYPINEWWTAYALLDLKTNPFYNNHIFYPLGQNLVQHTYTFLDGLFYTLLHHFMPLITFHNLLVWMTFFANSVAAYVLILYLTRMPWLSFIGAIAFAHSPTLTSYYKTICLLELYTFIFFILSSLHLIKTRRLRWAVCSGILLGLSLYNYPYYFLYGIIWLFILTLYHTSPWQFIVSSITGNKGSHPKDPADWPYRIIRWFILVLFLFAILAPRNIWEYIIRTRPIHSGYLHVFFLTLIVIWAIGRLRTLRQNFPDEWMLALEQKRLWHRFLGKLKLFLRCSLLHWRSSTIKEIFSLLSLIFVVIGVSAIIGFPYFYSFLTDETTQSAILSTHSEFIAYSVDFMSFFAPFNPLLDGLYEMIASNWKGGGPIIGTPAFLGYGFIVILILGLRQFFRRQELRLWIIALSVFLLLSLGPYLKVHGIVYESLILPGYLLHNLPLFESARTPSRYLAPVMILTSILTCLILRPFLLRIGSRARNIFLLIMFFIVSFEYGLVPYPMAGGMSDYRVPEVYRVLAQKSEGRTGTLLDLPLFIHSGSRSDGYGETRRFYYQTLHRQKLVGGVSSKLDEDVFAYFRNQPSVPELQLTNPVNEEELAALLYSFDINWIVLDKGYYSTENLEAYRKVFDNTVYLRNFYEDGRYLGIIVDQESDSLKRMALNFWERPDSLSRLIYPDFTRRPKPGNPQPLELIIPAKLWDYLELEFSMDTVNAFSAMRLHIDKGQEVLIQLPQTGSDGQANPISLKDIFPAEDLPHSPVRLIFYPIKERGGVRDIAFPFSLLSLGQSSGFRLTPSKALIGGRYFSIHKRGITAFRINEEGKVLERVYFDTHSSINDTNSLSLWLKRFSPEEYLALLVHDDGSYSLNEEVTGLLRTFGARDPIDKKDWQHSYAFLGKKGLPEGKAWEAHSNTSPAKISTPDQTIRLSDIRLSKTRPIGSLPLK
ncbi:MAG: interleukin-like EMT inducer domain-containing protein [Nitrospirota bacterium]